MKIVDKIIQKFDMAIYRLFYWRWNRKLEKNEDMRQLFIDSLTSYEEKD